MFYAVLFFYHWYEIMDEKPNTDEEWILHRTVITQDHLYALSLYAETPCPASVMLEAKTLEELNKEIEETKANYKNKEWLETNLYPFL